MLRSCSATILSLAIALPAADSAYVVPVMPGVVIKPIATAGDTLPAGVDATGVAVGGGATKEVVGIPDGAGAWDNGDGTFTLVANQELSTTAVNKGVSRAHGQQGAFLSRWKVNKTTLAVSTLADQVVTVYHYNTGGGAWSTTPTAPFLAGFDRFCSADLAPTTGLYNSTSGLGLPAATGRLFMNGEESSTAGYGRAWAHAVSGAHAGQSIQLPHVGLAGWENILVCPYQQDTTLVAATDDTSPGQVYFYVGTKQAIATTNGNVQDWIEAAGLVGGTLYAVAANGQASEQRTPVTGFIGVGAGKGVPLPFSLVKVNTPANVAAYTTVGAMDTATTAAGATLFLRPEDGVWDPVHTDTFYFNTTDRFDQAKNGGTGATTPVVGRTRLWRLKFNDITNPTGGGTITMLIDGSEDPGPQMLDNLTMDRFGRILLQEDPGNEDHAASIWVYDTNVGTLRKVAKHDPSRFGDRGYGSPGVNGAKISSVSPFDGDSSFTATAATGRSDEESSGIFDAQDLLGVGWFLFGTQAHSVTGVTAAMAERGQLMALYVPFAAAAGGATFQAGNLATITYGSGSVYGASILPVRDGGLGSGFAPVPGQTNQFYCLSDRGPNANATWISATSKVFPKPGFSPNIRRVRLNGDGTMTVLEQITLKRSDGTPLTGLPLPTGTDGSTNESAYEVLANGTVGGTLLSDTSGLDSEGLVAAIDGTFWVSDEYGPFICHFAADGTEIERISPFTAGAVSKLKLPSVLRQREINRGMEGLAISPDGTKLVGIMQSPLANSTTTVGGIPAGSGSGQSRRMLATRIVEITLATRTVKEYAYITDTRSTAINDIIPVTNTKFLILERDGNFPSSGSTVKKVYQVDLSTATDVHDPLDGVNGKLFTAVTDTPTVGVVGGTGTMEDIIRLKSASPSVAEVTAQLAAIGVTPLAKTLVVDLTNYKATYNHDKVEGLALVGTSLYVINDDDFGITDDDQDGLTNSAATPVLSKIILGSGVTQNVAAVSVKSGLQDYTQVLQIDLSALGSAITAPTFTTPVKPGSGLSAGSSSTKDDGSSCGTGSGAAGLICGFLLAALGLRPRRQR